MARFATISSRSQHLNLGLDPYKNQHFQRQKSKFSGYSMCKSR